MRTLALQRQVFFFSEPTEMLFPNTAYWIYTYPLLFSSKTMPPHVLVSLEQFLRNSWRKNMP